MDSIDGDGPVDPIDPAGPHYRRRLCGMACAEARSDGEGAAENRFRGE
jgi:hypothetical protein